MTRGFLWISAILLIPIMMMSCRQHECPPLRQEVVLRDAQIKDVNCNSAFPATFRGTSETLATAAWTFSANFGAVRTFMNFDLSSIPEGATILKAELTLFADTTTYINSTTTGHYGQNAWKIVRVTSDWAENTTSWANKPTYDNSGDAIHMPASTFYDQTYVVDVTRYIQDQFAQPNSYYGLMFQLETEAQYRLIGFCAREHRYAASLGPQLKISYVVR